MDEFMEEEIDLRDYLWVIYKRRWTIISIVTITLALGTVYTLTSIPIFRATTQILIEKENPNIVDFKELYTVDATTQDFYQTQYKILESKLLAKKVIEKLHLRNNEIFNPRPKQKKFHISGSIFAMNEREVQETYQDSPHISEFMANKLLGDITVEPVRNTRLVKIHYESEDPILAASIANAIVDSYIEHNLETQVEATYGATDFLNKKIDEQRKKLEESEILLHKFKEQHQIISLKERENITVAKLAELNSDVLKAENERVEAEMRFNQAQEIQDDPEMIESIPKVLSDAFITTLKTDEARLARELSELSKKYGDKHPRIISIKEKQRTIRNKLNTEIKKIVNYFKNEYEVALAKEKTLKKALSELKDESQALSKHAITYNVLLRDIEINQQMYEILLTRLKETGITSGIQPTNVRVLDKAMVPRSPVKPRKRLNILLSLITGLFGGIFSAFFLEYLDNTVKTPDDIKRYLQIPYLGPIPSYDGNDTLITLHEPKSTAAEAYKGIRTALIFSSSTSEKKTLLVTSAGPSEGKSLTVSNLAITMAQSNTKTLLVDVDLRKPRIHKIFNISKEKGISNLLVGESSLDDVIKKTDIPNLDIITCGHIPPNPAELLGSGNMKENMRLFRARYDKILFDTCPLLAITDTVILSTLVDEVLLVIQAGKSSREMIRRSIEQLNDVKANLLGTLLNNITTGQESYYQYYYYYYGEGESTRKKRTRRRKS
ncbi:MAG: GumC family protein [bacterium]